MPRDYSTLGPDAARVAADEARDRTVDREVPLPVDMLRRQAVADALSGVTVGFPPATHQVTVWEADRLAALALAAADAFTDGDEDEVDTVEAYWQHREAMDDARGEQRTDRDR